MSDPSPAWLDDLSDWLDGVLAVGTASVRSEHLRRAERLQTLVDQSGLTQLSAALADARQALRRKDERAQEAIARLVVVFELTRERLAVERMRS